MYFRRKFSCSVFSNGFNNASCMSSVRKPHKKLITARRHSHLQNLTASSIIISVSRDIYKNLALEDWLYKNHDLSSKNFCILLMWYNYPSVVIGRHQNPWLECSMDFSEASGIKIARRNSGGGTVYHDFGNLNCCFLTPRKLYDRKLNLNMICKSLKQHWPLNLSISQREDILLDNKYKVSGTASKLGRNNAYHHCTVLINVDQVMLHQALHRELCRIESKATSSVKSEVKNLQSVCPDICVPDVIKAVKEEYKSFYGVAESNIFNIEPKEDLCPGIKTLEDNLRSWKWCFGKTPRFHVTRSNPLCPSFSKWEKKNLPSCLEIKLSMHNGVIENVSILPKILEFSNLEALKQCICGVQFSASHVDSALENWITLSEDKVLSKYVKSCILQVIHDVYS